MVQSYTVSFKITALGLRNRFLNQLTYTERELILTYFSRVFQSLYRMNVLWSQWFICNTAVAASEHQSRNDSRNISSLVDDPSLRFQTFIMDRVPGVAWAYFQTAVPFDFSQRKPRTNTKSLIDQRLQIKLLFNNQRATKQTQEKLLSSLWTTPTCPCVFILGF